jgi:hypothetical protein
VHFPFYDGKNAQDDVYDAPKAKKAKVKQTYSAPAGTNRENNSCGKNTTLYRRRNHHIAYVFK